jgi:hypothetical protein
MSMKTSPKMHAKKHSQKEEHARTTIVAPTGVQPTHTPGPDDAHKTHDTHGEQRRVLEHSVKGGQAQRHPDTPAGIHSTGSFTGENDRKKK